MDSAAAAAKIVSNALSDPTIYKAMAAKEAEVWGKILPDREANAEAKLDRQAAGELRLNRNFIMLQRWAKKNGRTFERGLSVGCGEGRLERDLFRDGVCKSFTGLDMAEGALESARKQAALEGFAATYVATDLNFVELEADAYDLIVASTSLHHVLRLEHVADQLFRALRPGGTLWIHDYIGESQHQYSETRMRICNQIFSTLPEKYRYDRIFGRPLKPMTRKAPGTLISPFESIRSAEIAPTFLSRFELIERRETTSITNFLAPAGTRRAFAENDDSRALFETLLHLDAILIAEGVLTPVYGQYFLTKR